MQDLYAGQTEALRYATRQALDAELASLEADYWARYAAENPDASGEIDEEMERGLKIEVAKHRAHFWRMRGRDDWAENSLQEAARLAAGFPLD